MAIKRMISNHVIQTDKFMKMTQGAQLLYFHLNLSADDDGFNPAPYKVMESCKAVEEDMRQLVERGYVQIFKSGVIVIRHWLINNTLKEATYHPSIHTEEKDLLGADEGGEYQLLELLPTGSRSLSKIQYEKGNLPLSATDLRAEYRNVKYKLDSYSLESSVKSGVDTFAKSTLGERREEKRSKEESSSTPALEEDCLYGDEKNVFLLPEEYRKLCEKYEQVHKLINKVGYIFLNKRKLPLSHYGYICKIALEDGWPVKKRDKQTSEYHQEQERQEAKKNEEIQMIMELEKIDEGAATKIYEQRCEDAKKAVMEKVRRMMQGENND